MTDPRIPPYAQNQTIRSWGGSTPRRDPPMPPRGSDVGGLPLDRATFNVWPVWMEPPRSAVRFFTRGIQTFTGVGAETLDVVFAHPYGGGFGGLGANFAVRSVPNGSVFVLDYWEMMIRDCDEDVTSVYMTFLANGAPIPGLDFLQVPPVVSAASFTSGAPRLILGQGVQLAATITQSLAVLTPYAVGAAVSGWVADASDLPVTAEAGVFLP